MAASSGTPSRRGVLLAALAAGTLAGCGEASGGNGSASASAPPDPKVEVLEASYAACVLLAELAGATDGDLGPTLAAIHTRQADSVRTLLIRSGAPDPTRPSPTASGSGTPTGSASPTPSATQGNLATEEGRAARLDGVGALDDRAREVIASILSQHAAAAQLLGQNRPSLPESEASTDLSSAIAATAEAVWMFEYIAARAAGEERDRARATRDALKAVLAEQRARSSAQPRLPFGYARPSSNDPTTLSLLAGSTLTGLTSVYGTQLAPMSATAPDLAAITSWLATAAVQAYTWEQPLEAFPGLVEPAPSPSPSASVQQ